VSEENVEIARKHLDALNAFMRGEISSEAWLCPLGRGGAVLSPAGSVGERVLSGP
jgi:hypothetical protein